MSFLVISDISGKQSVFYLDKIGQCKQIKVIYSQTGIVGLDMIRSRKIGLRFKHIQCFKKYNVRE